jgi:phosphoglycolate phosphatase-like HAD superfamily hydrolase
VRTVDNDTVRTKGEILARYRDELGIEDRLVMVGDRRSDLLAARQNGAYFIGCAFGHAGDAELGDADIVVRSYAEMAEHLGTIPGF